VIKYRIVHRYGKWHVIEFVPTGKKYISGELLYTSKVIVKPTTKKLAEAYLKLLGVTK
jgi:hypothetical protein